MTEKDAVIGRVVLMPVVVNGIFPDGNGNMNIRLEDFNGDEVGWSTPDALIKPTWKQCKEIFNRVKEDGDEQA